MFFLTFISSFYLIVYLVRFNTNNKHHFLPFYVNACVQLHNLHLKLVYDNKQPCLLKKMALPLIMKAENNGKFTQYCNFQKTSFLKYCRSGIWDWRFLVQKCYLNVVAKLVTQGLRDNFVRLKGFNIMFQKNIFSNFPVTYGHESQKFLQRDFLRELLFQSPRAEGQSVHNLFFIPNYNLTFKSKTKTLHYLGIYQ